MLPMGESYTILTVVINLLEQLKLRDAVSIAMHIRSSSLGNRNRQQQQQQQNSLTAGELLRENPEIKKNCYTLMRNIRGTAAYWQRDKLDLFAMFRTLGPPSYFITLSADDTNWPDLMYVLVKRDGQHLTDEQVLEMTKSERVRLLCAYPVIVAQHSS